MQLEPAAPDGERRRFLLDVVLAALTLGGYLGALEFASRATGLPPDRVLLQPMSHRSVLLDLAGVAGSVGAVAWGYLVPGSFLVRAFWPRLAGTTTALAAAVMASAVLAYGSMLAAARLLPASYREGSLLLLAGTTVLLAALAWRRGPRPLLPPRTLRVGVLAALSALLLFSPKFTAEDVSMDGVTQVLAVQKIAVLEVEREAAPGALDRSALGGLIPPGWRFLASEPAQAVASAPCTVWLGVSDSGWMGPWSWSLRLPFLVMVMLLAATLWTMIPAGRRASMAGALLAHLALFAMLCLYTASSDPHMSADDAWPFLFGGVLVLWLLAALREECAPAAAAAHVAAALLEYTLMPAGFLLLGLHVVLGSHARTAARAALLSLPLQAAILWPMLRSGTHTLVSGYSYVDKYLNMPTRDWSRLRFFLMALAALGGPAILALFDRRSREVRVWAALVVLVLAFLTWSPHRDLQHLAPVAFLPLLAMARRRTPGTGVVLAGLLGLLVLLWPVSYPVQRIHSRFWTVTWADVAPSRGGSVIAGLMNRAGLRAASPDQWPELFARRAGAPEEATFLILPSEQPPPGFQVRASHEGYVLATRAAGPELLLAFREPPEPWELYRPLLGVLLGRAWSRTGP